MMKKTHWSLMIAAGLVTLAVSGCGSSSLTGPAMGGSTPTPTPATVPTPADTPMATPTPASLTAQATISGFAFSALTVSVNTTVTWMNNDSVPHTATADGGSAFQFDTGNIPAGTMSQGILFTQAGTFTYHCNVHPSMHGTIVVQ